MKILKKIISVALVIATIFTFSGCQKKNQESKRHLWRLCTTTGWTIKERYSWYPWKLWLICRKRRCKHNEWSIQKSIEWGGIKYGIHRSNFFILFPTH